MYRSSMYVLNRSQTVFESQCNKSEKTSKCIFLGKNIVKQPQLIVDANVRIYSQCLFYFA